MQPQLDTEFAAAITRIIFGYIGRGFLIIASIVFLVSAWIYVGSFVRYQNVDNWAGSKENKESYFTQSRPSARDINDYLSDATIMVSDSQNSITYFDDDHRLFTWFGNRLDEGFWKITWNLKLLTFESGTRRRSVVAYVFCHGRDGVVREDHCYSVDKLSDIFPFGGREYRKGDVFKIRGASSAPMLLPDKPALSIEQVLQLMSSGTLRLKNIEFFRNRPAQ
jgi:hypothetical protein